MNVVFFVVIASGSRISDGKEAEMLGSRKLHCRIGSTARALALLAVLGIGGTGCRFGNQVILAKDPAALSGFYKTEAESMSICAKLTGQDWRCAAMRTPARRATSSARAR